MNLDLLFNFISRILIFERIKTFDAVMLRIFKTNIPSFNNECSQKEKTWKCIILIQNCYSKTFFVFNICVIVSIYFLHYKILKNIWKFNLRFINDFKFINKIYFEVYKISVIFLHGMKMLKYFKQHLKF